MALIRRGEFTIESSFDNPNDVRVNQRADIRIPHERSGRSPLVFRVDLWAIGFYGRNEIDESEPVHHEVLVQNRQAQLLIAYELGYLDTYRYYPQLTRSFEYINGSLFTMDQYKKNPDRYQIRSYVGRAGTAGSTLPVTINVGEYHHYRRRDPEVNGWNEGDWFNEVKDEGDMRVFAVRCEKGANKIAIPRDLRPYVAHLRANNKTTFAEKDLALAVDFETYPL